MTHRREKRDTTYVVSLFLKQETVLRTFSSPVPNQIAIQRKRLRFGEEEQQNERALTFIKNRSKRYKACSDVEHHNTIDA